MYQRGFPENRWVQPRVEKQNPSRNNLLKKLNDFGTLVFSAKTEREMQPQATIPKQSKSRNCWACGNLTAPHRLTAVSLPAEKFIALSQNPSMGLLIFA